jgi:hypothetical protein
MRVIVPIVEGHGEVQAVPVLIRRIATEICDPPVGVRVQQPIRIPKDKLKKAGELERAVELAARRAVNDGGILILIDANDDCPARLGPDLVARAQTVGASLRLGVVLANREFEAWFLAAAISLRGRRRLDNRLSPPSNPEAVRGAKEWLSDRMPLGWTYSETTDQAALTAEFDMITASACDSFAKCLREITALICGD